MHRKYNPKITNQPYVPYNYNKNPSKSLIQQTRASSQDTLHPPNLPFHELKLMHTKYAKLAQKYQKQNKFNAQLLAYTTLSNQYQNNLHLDNLNLNNTVNTLLSDKLSLTNTCLLQKKKNTNQNMQMMNALDFRSEQLQRSKSMIYNLMDNKVLLQSRVQKLGYELQQEYQAKKLEAEEMKIRFQGLQLQMKELLRAKDSRIEQLERRISMYDKQMHEIKEQNNQYKLAILENELQQKKLHNIDKSSKNSTQYEKQILAAKRKILQLEKEREELKQQNVALKQELSILNDVKSKQKQLQNVQEQIYQKNKKQIMTPRKDGSIVKHYFFSRQKLLASIVTLRNGINKEIFEIFIKSVIEGDRNRSNSLTIFTSRWKSMEIQRITPYVQSYMQARQASLLVQAQYQTHLNLQNQSQDSDHAKFIQQLRIVLPNNLFHQQSSQLPHHISTRSPGVYKIHSQLAYKQKLQHRSNINLWILSTIQFTINQQEILDSSDKNLKNWLLYLFRILTIQYRITYPMKGQKYQIDQDVRNCLLDRTVQAVWKVIKNI